MGIKLTTEERARLIKVIQDFFYQERDEEIGIIAAEKVLDFFIEHLGIAIYNKSLADIKKHLTEKIEDMQL